MAVDGARRVWHRLFAATGCAGVIVVAGLTVRPFVLDELAIRSLESGGEGERREAAAWVARRRCVRAIPALIAIPLEDRTSYAGIWPRYVAQSLESLLGPGAAQIVRSLPAKSRWEAWRIQAALDCGDRSDAALGAIASVLGHEHLGLAPPSALGAFGKRAVPHLLGTFQGTDMAGADLEHIWSHSVSLSLSSIGPGARDAIPELLREIARGPLDGTEWRRRDAVMDPQGAAALALSCLGVDMLDVDGSILDGPRAEVRAGAARRLGLFLAPGPERFGVAEALARLASLEGQSVRVRAIVQFLEDRSQESALVSATSDAFSDAAVGVREAILAVLAELDSVPESLVEPLKSLLGAGDQKTRALAARALLGIESGRNAAQTVLLELAAAGQLDAIEALGKWGTGADVPMSLLERLLGNAGTDVRTRAAVALARIDPDAGMKAAVKTLFAWLEAEDSDLHNAAAEALHSLGPGPAAAPLLAKLGASGGKEARVYAALLLTRTGVTSGAPIAALGAWADDDMEESGALAALALHVLGDDSEKVRLRAFSEHSSAGAIALLTDAFARSEPSALDLQAFLSLQSWPERTKAWQRAECGAFLWSRLATGQAPPPLSLLRLARDRRANATLRLRAALASVRAGSTAMDFVPNLIDAAASWGGPGLLLEPLARVGPACVPHVLEALEKSSSVELTATLMLALGRMGAPASAAAPALSRFLDHRDPALVITAARGLGRMGRASAPAIPKLEALSRSKGEVAGHAAEALERIARRPDGDAPLQRQYGAPLLRPGSESAPLLHDALCARKR